ncbi:unnamed protein product [Plutella xylostella]|uniref:(diamondback moth) hypothetical protein n=1 Tax=Plutella xylostella TaxID=51655 RepID=A0A8S4FE06_PLUXY|nr:NPC intracellular cholesterol transporter 2 [Plutella xylostella]CAG9126457.1 unnamed protein product [Plutella xylostella]
MNIWHQSVRVRGAVMWSYTIVALLCAAAAVDAELYYNSTAVTRCTRSSRAELPMNVYIQGCVDPPCSLTQLKDAEMDVVFQAPRYLEDMETLATAYLGIVPIPYPLGQDSFTCNNLVNSYCPLLEGEVLKYKLKLYIEEFMAVGVSANIEFRVRERGGADLFCFRTNIRIVR